MVTYVSQGKFVCAFEELLLSFFGKLESYKACRVPEGEKKTEQIQISEGIFTQII